MANILEDNGVGHHFYQIAIIASICMLVILKGRRKSFVIPTLLMGLVIVNPWFKDLWLNKLQLGYYYRVLWLVPVIPVCAALPAAISERIGNPRIKGIIALICAGIYILSGSFVYKHELCRFSLPSTNASKLPQDTVDVADYLLSLEDNPRVIADRRISIYIRQYAGEINSLFGRDVDGYICGPSETARRVNNQINDPEGDMAIVVDAMREENYPYLVIENTNEKKAKCLYDNGLVLLNTVDQWGIYSFAKQ